MLNDHDYIAEAIESAVHDASCEPYAGRDLVELFALEDDGEDQ